MKWICHMLTITALLIPYSCATNPIPDSKKIVESEKKIIETDERLVKECHYLGSITATTDFGKTFASYAKWRCKKEARRKAARLGATHIVWLHVYPTAATALAYNCHIP